jgi:tetratricopeptide (TPR) repeat protein
MRASLHQSLAPIRRRQQTSFALQCVIYGLLFGAIAGIAAALSQWWITNAVSPWLAASIGVGAALGLVVGLMFRRSWHDAAAAVDAHYCLKDRSLTALEFLNKNANGDLHQLQIGDALAHLGNVEPAKVAPIRSPRVLPYALVASVVALLLPFLLPKPAAVNAEPVSPLAHIVAEAEKIQERLQDLEEIAKQEDNPELKELVEKLKDKAEEMKQPEVDEKEALAKLSEMQAAIQAQMAQFNTAIVDGQMQSLGAALSSSTALEGAGKALSEVKLEKAVQELEKIEDPQIDRKEAKALDEKLKQVAKAMSDVGLGQCSAAVSEFAESVKGGKSNIGKASKNLAKEVGNQAKKRKLNMLLNRELEDLKECKCNCQCNSLVTGKKPQKSKSPSSNWGMTSSGNIDGEKTSLLSQRQKMDLTGTPGEGPSDTETTSSPEARQQASRGIKKADYDKYKKLSEAVLESEAIPLGQRQLIRKYFELIRPTNSEMTDKEKDKEKRN